MRGKYGVRVLKEDEQTAWTLLRPGIEYVNLESSKIFEISPVPHGTQRTTIIKLLKECAWPARPLQPGRGTFSHMSWRVGSTQDPPKMVMQGFETDVVISPIKDLSLPKLQPQIVASSKTQKHLVQASTGASSSSTPSTDPWLKPGADPWVNYPKPQPAPNAGRTRLAEIQDQLCQDVTTKIRKELEQHASMEVDGTALDTANAQTAARFQALEVGLTEVKQQNAQFLAWFGEAGERMKKSESTMGDMQQTMNKQQQDLHTLNQNVTKSMKSMKTEISQEISNSFQDQMTRLEALLEKRQKNWLARTGSRSRSTWMPGSFLRPMYLFFMILLTSSRLGSALQHQSPFARHFVPSSATSVDRVIGSGADCCALAEHLLDDHDLHGYPLSVPSYTQRCRLGEAMNPGPDICNDDSLLTVGVGNPGGLRGKESLLMDLGPGIWTMTETQLSSTTMRTTAGILRADGRKMNRAVRPLFSAPAPLRVGSQWAGTWSGVATIADFPSARLELPWPTDHWQCARTLVTRHWIGKTPVVIGGFYGYAQGPTWPRSKQLSDALLITLTQEVIIGMQGIRIIQGDFNYEPGELQQHLVWQRYGWRNAQDVAAELFNHEVTMTCKHRTQRDQIWLSPEAIRCIRGLKVFDCFADHRIVAASFDIPVTTARIPTWPRPTRLPWDQIQIDEWEPECHLDFVDTQDSTQFFSNWASAYEEACDQQLQASGHFALPNSMKGRAQRLAPYKQSPHTPSSKPSRAGEVQLINALGGSATKRWFKQLRRLQSLKHSVQAGCMSASAVTYRTELWSAVIRAKGFSPSFRDWWRLRTPALDDSPRVLPQGPPVVGTDAVLLYEEFLIHFRKFEQWHLTQRTASLKAKYEGSLQAIFKDLRSEPRHSIDHLWHERSYAILAIDSATGQLHLDQPIATNFDSVWLHDGSFVSITDIAGDLCTLSSLQNVFEGDELVQRIFVSDTCDMMSLFRQYWQPRWNILHDISASDWQRITSFAVAHMPRGQFQVDQLEVPQWRNIVKQFKPGAARGPDGFSKEDMLHVPTSYLESLLHLFTAIEDTDVPWPEQLLLGLVIGLAKQPDSHEVGHFRPINLFSMWFRAWARLRTKEMVRQLADIMPAEALGFLPSRETAEVWMILQSHIEVMLQLGQDFCGMSTDLQKAFNCIGRPQVFLIANHVGIPQKLLHPWQKFLTSFSRRFEIRTQVSEPLMSSSGFPEGDPLSILAMLCVNWTYHVYMKIFAPRVCSYSFVDNLTLAAVRPEHIAQAFFALKTLCALFGLSTDDSKTYVWGLSKMARSLLVQLDFPVLQDASELGGSMTYGAAIRNRSLKQRGLQLGDKWQKLRRSFAPQLQKFAVLPKVFWPKAFHGSVNCLIADGYANDLRKQAVKAIRANGAGSNPMLRLSLSDDIANDPGYYQLHLCLSTFQRLLRKSPDLLVLWRIRMTGFDGKLLPGPFSRLMQCLSQIGWSIFGATTFHGSWTALLESLQHWWQNTASHPSWCVVTICQCITAPTDHAGSCGNGRFSYNVSMSSIGFSWTIFAFSFAQWSFHVRGRTC